MEKCPECGTELPPNLLACPVCQRLTHADELRSLSEAALQAGATPEALALWRRAYALLPRNSRQAELIAAKITELVKVADRSPTANPAAGWGKGAGRAGAIGVFLISILSKGKLLLLGLTKMSTLLTMLLSFGIYWQIWGWKFAAGLVLSIYVHEMGHIFMLRRLGVAASAPMFIPGFGALIRLRTALPSASEDARVGLAGPIWGLGAAAFAWTLALTLHSPLMEVIAKLGAWINLFNLMPVWQLDGARGWRALSRVQRWVATGVVGVALAMSAGDVHVVLFAILALSVVRLFGKEAPAVPDWRALSEYVLLIAALTFLASLQINF